MKAQPTASPIDTRFAHLVFELSRDGHTELEFSGKAAKRLLSPETCHALSRAEAYSGAIQIEVILRLSKASESQ